jgi:hypothetical protein
MKSEKAAYWFAVLVFALILHGSYQRGAFPSVHVAAQRTGSELCQLTAHLQRTYAVAKALATDDDVRANDLLSREEVADLVEAQSDFVRNEAQDKVELLRDQLRAQAEVRRAELQLRHDQVRQLRDMARVQIRNGQFAGHQFMVVVPKSCEHSRLKISTAPLPEVDTIVSDDDSDSF